MDYVNSLALFGAPQAKEIPSITKSGAPTKATEGAVGCLYMNTDNGDMYKCTAVVDGVYTWVEVASGKGSNTPPIINTVSGELVSITDSAERPLQGLTVFGKTTQATTTGKNLLNLTGRVVSTDTVGSNTAKRAFDGNQIFVGISADNYLNPGNILSYTVRETSVTVTSKQGAYGIGFDVEVTPGNTYAFSVAEKSYMVRCSFYQADGTHISFTNDAYGSIVCTAPNHAKWVVVIVMPVGDTVNKEITFTNLQFELGTVATAYEPYGGGTATPNPEFPQDLVSVGNSKNLIDPAAYIKGTSSTLDGDVITTNFKGSWLCVNAVDGYIKTHPRGTYTATFFPVTAGAACSFFVYSAATKAELKAKYSVTAGSPSFTFTVDEEFYLSLGGIEPFGEYSYRLQLEAGTVSTAYEPYGGGSIAVSVAGKNLINPVAYMTDAVHTTLDGDVFTSNFKDGALYINVNRNNETYLPKGTYTATLFPLTEGITCAFFIYSAATKAQLDVKYSVTTDNPSFTFTINEAFYFAVGGMRPYGEYSYKLQLEAGTASTAYEPYKAPQTLSIPTPNGLPGIPVTTGGNYTDQKGQQWICDEVDFTRGVYVQRVGKKTFSTKDGWGVAFVSSSGLYRFYTTISNTQPNDSAVFCNLAKGVSFDKRSFSTDGICFMYAAESSFAVMTSAATTLDEWGALLAQTPMELLFVAQTSTETALDTDTLAAYRALATHYPSTIVTAEGATTQVSYVADTKLYIDNKIAALSAALLNA